MAESDNFNNWYREYRKKYLDREVKKCKAFAVVSGTVATLSALVVAGDLIIGNGLEALQVGGATFALAAYLSGYSRASSLHKSELKRLNENTDSESSYQKDRLEALKYEFEINGTYLSMNHLVAGGFYLSALGYFAELLTMQGPSSAISSGVGAALSILTGTLSLSLINTCKKRLRGNKTEIDLLETDLKDDATPEVDEMIIDLDGAIEVDVPSSGDEVKKLVFEENSIIKK